MTNINHAFLSAGLADVAHVVEDSPYLASIVRAIQLEREAMGQVQTQALRDLAVMSDPELAEAIGKFIAAGERVF